MISLRLSISVGSFEYPHRDLPTFLKLGAGPVEFWTNGLGWIRHMEM